MNEAFRPDGNLVPRASDLPLPAVGLFMFRRQVALNFYLARALKRDFGSRIYFYVRTELEKRGFDRDLARLPEKICDEVIVADRLIEGLMAQGLDREAVVRRARHYEELTGFTVNRMTFGHRVLSLGFSAGALDYPRPRYFKEATYESLLYAYAEELAFWESEIAEKKLTLLIDAGNQAWLIARANGVAYRRLVPARYKNYQFWTPDEFHSHPKLDSAYAKAVPRADVVLDEYYHTAQTKYAVFWSSMKLRAMIANSLSVVLWYLYRTARRLPNRSSESLLKTMWRPFRQASALRTVSKLSSKRVADLAGVPYAYFPLHKEPEVAFLQRSPEHFDQLSTILAVARDLPAGVMLAVKENLYSIGRRPKNFYRQLADLKNVVFLALDEEPLECVRNAAVTVTITGTAGLEAAALGRPVVTFGRHSLYAFLPHVRLVTEASQLRDALNWALEGRFDAERAKTDGQRLLVAIVDSSIDMGSYRVKRNDKYGATDEVCAKAYEVLIDSLGLHGAEAAAGQLAQC